jgi:hydrogenase maturation protein HypF
MESRRIHVRGTVQGVGFRPFVWRLAREHRLRGWVQNYGSEVLIVAHGSTQMIDSFVEGLQHHSLPRAVIGSIHCEPISPPSLPSNDASTPEFLILDSSSQAATDPNIPPDAATCDACLDEMNDPGNRRYAYPFIQCNDCGPRFTIIDSLPFDRARTTMRYFPLCSQCQAEYRDPYNRRFHCQTIACPTCGPQLTWLPSGQTGSDAIRAACDAVQAGKIIAVKGVGGFHLACDARNDRAVADLRHRKGRGDKPLAVMVRDLEMAQRFVDGSPQAWSILSDWTRPIVLLPTKLNADVSCHVAPGIASLGLMLPYSPIHHLLLKNASGPWVMTSGNRSDEPIAIDNDEAISRLSGIADGFLMHNRTIAAMCDDSVVRVRGDVKSTLRRARGMVPAAIAMGKSCEDMLATGADLKGTFCLVRGNRAYVSQPFGDLVDRETMDALHHAESRWEQWLGISPIRFAADMHPLYHASQWARDRAEPRGSRPILIQHHHAHLAALMAEHQIDPEAHVLGFIFDGTGYGTDSTIWGGEAIALRQRRFERIASLEPFPLPGGDAAVRFPNRMALALLHHSGIPWSDDLPSVAACEPPFKYLFKQLLERGTSSVATTSMGRLFDGVASLLGVRQTITYEAQAAIELEVLAAKAEDSCDDSEDMRWLRAALKRAGPAFPTAECLRELVDRMRRGTPPAILARWFHRAVAEWIRVVTSRYREQHGPVDVGLSGGVFQNELLSTLATNQLEQAGFRVRTHQSWPCHDGSIALGQAWIACHLPNYETEHAARPQR